MGLENYGKFTTKKILTPYLEATANAFNFQAG